MFFFWYYTRCSIDFNVWNFTNSNTSFVSRNLSYGFFPSQSQPPFDIHPFQAWWPSKMKRSFVARFTVSESDRSKRDNKKKYCIPQKIAGEFCCSTKMKELENLMVKPIFVWRSLENTVLRMFILFCSICFGSSAEGRQRGTMFKACCFGIYMYLPDKKNKQVIQVAASTLIPSLQRQRLQEILRHYHWDKGH